MDKQKSIEALQFFVTGLSEGAFVHKVQGQIFKAQGFTKLGEKYIGHYTEEMEWVEKFIDRILDLGGEVKCMGSVCEDYLTFDILKDYLADEEEDLYWSQGALEMIEKIGAQNWLIMQM